MRILVVEDDHKIGTFVQKGLREAGYAVDWRKTGPDALDLAISEKYDLIVLDLMLPGIGGLDLLALLRKNQNDVPVLILSAKTSVEDRVSGLQSGSDDYMIKPFAFSELLARAQALMRRPRTNGVGPNNTSLEACGLKIDLLKREVFRDGHKVELQSKEFALLEFLMRHPERILSKTLILEHVYEFDFDPQTNVVDVLVCSVSPT